MKPVDIIAIILTITICYLLAVSITAATIRGEPISEIGMKLVDKMTIAIISIISMYVGSKIKTK
jgi:hypothetical protein